MRSFYLELPDSPRARDAVRDAATGMGMEWSSDYGALTEAWMAGGDTHEAMDQWAHDVCGPSWLVEAWPGAVLADEDEDEDECGEGECHARISVSWEGDDEAAYAARDGRYGRFSGLPFEPSRGMPAGRLVIHASLAADDWERFTDALDERLLDELSLAGIG